MAKDKTLFYENLLKDEAKLSLYNQAVQDEKITNFDQTLLTRLRKHYYGLYSGLIYMYYEPTNSRNIGNKVELMAHMMSDKDFQIVHGETDSTRDIDFYSCIEKELDFNSWFEVQEGHKTWVYDLFSMLRMEKEIYYELENPTVKNIVPKSFLVLDSNEFKMYSNGLNFMLIRILPIMENAMISHPFSDILTPEITRFKKKIDYDNIVIETREILEEMKKK